MKRMSVYLAVLLLGFISWSCTNQDDLSQTTLKSSITTSVQELSVAMTDISNSAGYNVLGVSDSEIDASKVSTSWDFTIDSTMYSILLSDIAGVYDYKANYDRTKTLPVLRFFTKTGESDNMVVRLPEEKVKHPRTLMFYNPADSLLVNNYIISLNQYEYYYNRFLGWDYKMASNINIKDVDAGNLQIQSSSSKENGYKYTSAFEFADGYKASCNYVSGDTAAATYSITSDTKTLYEEKYTSYKSALENRFREKQYTLIIGDVKIVRTPGIGFNALDSAKVYVNDVLQTNAKVEIIDVEITDDTDNPIVNHKRDLQITFDDGTTTTISALLGESVGTIRNLFIYLRQASFSTAIIDKIAWEINLSKI